MSPAEYKPALDRAERLTALVYSLPGVAFFGFLIAVLLNNSLLDLVQPIALGVALIGPTIAILLVIKIIPITRSIPENSDNPDRQRVEKLGFQALLFGLSTGTGGLIAFILTSN